ncbi:MAG: type II 3-dehydroquinate dehydratase [Gemmatimonadetes bacterium]|nr:type II 3-dehydroquinate dehydratase [Gemmatimonadota bacterium]|tara:strand:+ start:5171 stop:5605 length:435 start_codon:yes stop_codon:yes gene_type:complete
MKIAVIHGPNLRSLGKREPEVYGTDTLEDINDHLQNMANELGIEITAFQSNHEGELIDYIERTALEVEGFLINPGAYTHTSIALRDAFVGVEKAFVEVHLSNTSAREHFRRHSYLAPVAAGMVYGFGLHSYLLGLQGLVAKLKQ